MRRLVVFLAVLLLSSMQSTALPTIVGSYCIAGSSDTGDYSWWIDCGADGLGMLVEPQSLNGNSVFPNGALEPVLASSFVNDINASTFPVSGVCTASVCSVGLIGNACTNDADCDSCMIFGTCDTNTAICTTGPLIGEPCTTDAECSVPVCCVSASALGSCFSLTASSAFDLYVGLPGTPNCPVTPGPCTYNPDIKKVASIIPTLGGWGMVILTILLISGSLFLAYRRRRSDTAVPTR